MDDESDIRRKLQQAFPSLQWEEGDSSWDKVRVWADSPELAISIYRYESPGPFRLRIFLRRPDTACDQAEFRAIREQVLVALKATLPGQTGTGA